MKRKTKLGLLLAAVASATFYVVHKIAGKARPAIHTPESTHTTAPPASPPKTSAPVPGHAPAAPADPFKPLPGQADPGVHFDQPGAPVQAGVSKDPLTGWETPIDANGHAIGPPRPPAQGSTVHAPGATSSQDASGSGWGEGS